MTLVGNTALLYRWAFTVRVALTVGIVLSIPCARAQFDNSLKQSEELPASAIRIAEPRPDEVVIVINVNAVFGNHAGILAGSRLSDPAGSYFSLRSHKQGWTPSLADYVRYQSSDGPNIRVYRFQLEQRDLEIVAARLDEADKAAPLFCATAVQNAVARVGPFAGIPRAGWTSPASVATLLDRLLASGGRGSCELPDSSDCTKTLPIDARAPTVAQGQVDN